MMVAAALRSHSNSVQAKQFLYLRGTHLICQACSQSWQISCQILRQGCSQTCPQGGSQARWQPSLQPSLWLESPLQWPLLSMCSSSKTSTYARKSGTQCLSLSRPERASEQTIS